MRSIWWIFLLASGLAAGASAQTAVALSQQSQTCVECHEATSPGIVGQWKESAHEKSHVGCFECHQAEKGARDAFEHNGFLIATIVSPKDCSHCHEGEYRQIPGQPPFRSRQDSGQSGQCAGGSGRGQHEA